MKIELKKIPFQSKEFETSLNNIVLKGIFYKENHNVVKIEAKLCGQIDVVCNRCTVPFIREIKEDLKLIVTDKIYNGFDKEYDVIEIFSNFINFDDIITSEIESVKLEFDNICDNCEQIDLEI